MFPSDKLPSLCPFRPQVVKEVPLLQVPGYFKIPSSHPQEVLSLYFLQKFQWKTSTQDRIT